MTVDPATARAGQRVSLLCNVSSSLPAATIRWFRGPSEIDPDYQQINQPGVSTAKISSKIMIAQMVCVCAQGVRNGKREYEDWNYANKMLTGSLSSFT